MFIVMFFVPTFSVIFLWLMPSLLTGFCPMGCAVVSIPGLLRSFELSFILGIVGTGLVLWRKGSGILQVASPMMFKQNGCIIIKRMTLGSGSDHELLLLGQASAFYEKLGTHPIGNQHVGIKLFHLAPPSAAS